MPSSSPTTTAARSSAGSTGAAQMRVLLKTASRIVVRNAASVAGGRRLSRTRRYVATRGLSGTVTLRSASGRRPRHVRVAADDRRAPAAASRCSARSANAADRRALPRRPAAPRGRARRGLGDQRPRPRRLRPRRRRPRDARELAAGGAARAGRRRAHLCAGDAQGRRRLRPLRRHPLAGLQRHVGETAATDEAVAQTRGKVVAYKGKPVITYFFSTSGGRTEDVQNSFLGAEPAPYLTSVDDPFDSLSPRHRWTRRMSLRTAQRRLGSLVQRQPAAHPRAAAGQLAACRARADRRIARQADRSGPTLRRKLGLYDTWARFTVITASATRGDGNTPRTPASPAPPGGTAPQLARGAAVSRRPARPSIGRIRGRIDPAPRRAARSRSSAASAGAGRRPTGRARRARALHGADRPARALPRRDGRDVGPSVSVRTRADRCAARRERGARPAPRRGARRTTPRGRRA